ncbi:MAG: hypothetical protein BGO43_08260 [Gammaproteobacteria bacterium 39-13]|nr:MAG: hypothetical protein BGO43_08260 [Gammaproteobacteria bacterium 39-13]
MKSLKFKEACLYKLNGAIGIFVAYNRNVLFEQPKKLDKKVESDLLILFKILGRRVRIIAMGSNGRLMIKVLVWLEN